MKSFRELREKTLTPAEKNTREEIAKAMERENPGMDMSRKMAIATWQAKKVAEGYRVHAVSKDGEKMKSGLHPTKKAASDMHYKMSKSGMYKKIEVVKEAKEDDMPASPDEASMAMKQLEFIEYAAEEMMDHIKSGKPFPEWFQNKLSKAHGEIEGLHSAMGEHGGDNDEDMKEATELDEISLSHLSNAIAKSTGTKNIKTAMKPGEVKKGLDDLKKRLGTLGKEPQKEAAELDELSKKTLGSYVKKASRDVANRSADNARDVAKNGAKPGLNKKTMKNWRREIGIDMAIDKMTKEAVVSADKKPEKYVKPDGTVGIRMVRVDKKVIKDE
jgi:hypothetical protein